MSVEIIAARRTLAILNERVALKSSNFAVLNQFTVSRMLSGTSWSVPCKRLSSCWTPTLRSVPAFQSDEVISPQPARSSTRKVAVP